MIGDKVNDHPQSGSVRPVHQSVKVVPPRSRVIGQVGIDIVVVLDRIGGAGTTLYHIGVIVRDPRVRGGGGMLEDAGIPDMGKAQPLEVSESLTGDVTQLTTAILLDRATGAIFPAHVTVESGQYLIDQQLAIISIHDDVVSAYHL